MGSPQERSSLRKQKKNSTNSKQDKNPAFQQKFFKYNKPIKDRCAAKQTLKITKNRDKNLGKNKIHKKPNKPNIEISWKRIHKKMHLGLKKLKSQKTH